MPRYGDTGSGCHQKKDGRYTIGEYPGVSLADARREREWAREQVRQGKNPTIVKDTEKLMVMGDAANTFKSIAEEWYERKCQTWAEKTQIVNRGFLDKHILPAIGKIPVKDVKAAHILALMRKLEKAGNAYSAGKVRQICSAVFLLRRRHTESRSRSIVCPSRRGDAEAYYTRKTGNYRRASSAICLAKKLQKPGHGYLHKNAGYDIRASTGT
ncbi:integrase arm-type DNA-binding domain-containing protein [Cronobacter sakazakii]|nr:integrase arm-type DNA-binding domain-containing protein [Cronobacter sakazakii]